MYLPKHIIRGGLEMVSYEKRIKELGITFPEVLKPAAAYIPAKKSG